MALLWIILGITLSLGAIISYYWIKFDAPTAVLLIGLSGILFFVFAVIWAIVLMYKGEPMTAALGMVTLGIPGILLVAAGWRLIATNSQTE